MVHSKYGGSSLRAKLLQGDSLPCVLGTIPRDYKVQQGRDHSEGWLDSISFQCGSTLYGLVFACHKYTKGTCFFFDPTHTPRSIALKVTLVSSESPSRAWDCHSFFQHSRGFLGPLESPSLCSSHGPLWCLLGASTHTLQYQETRPQCVYCLGLSVVSGSPAGVLPLSNSAAAKCVSEKPLPAYNPTGMTRICTSTPLTAGSPSLSPILHPPRVPILGRSPGNGLQARPHSNHRESGSTWPEFGVI